MEKVSRGLELKEPLGPNNTLYKLQQIHQTGIDRWTVLECVPVSVGTISNYPSDHHIAFCCAMCCVVLMLCSSHVVCFCTCFTHMLCSFLYLISCIYYTICFTCIIGVFTLKVLCSNMSDRMLLMFDDKNEQQDNVTKKFDVWYRWKTVTEVWTMNYWTRNQQQPPSI